MASLRQTKSGSFIICFRFEGQQLQRSLKTKERDAAKALQGKIEHTLFQLANGHLTVPDGVDPGDFIVNGLTTPRPQKPSAPPPTFASLIEPYLEDKRGQKAESSLQTERTHLNNLCKMLGRKASFPMNRITKEDLEAALKARHKDVTATTVMKERQTLMLFFEWAAERNDSQLRSSPAANLSSFQEDKEKPRFRTLDEIEQILAREGLSNEEVEKYWDCLFLDLTQVGELLDLVRGKARHDFVHPMVSLAAFTGMRRGEILRLRWADVNFEPGLVTARSKKQSRQTTETSRDIPMHADLQAILIKHQQQRPQGQYVICRSDSLNPLTKHMAHDHFRRTLSKTRWERTMPDGSKKVIVGFHTLRHSLASNLAVQGVDQRLIDSIMGHQTEEMRKRYQHLHPKSRQAAIDVLSFASTHPSKTGSKYARLTHK